MLSKANICEPLFEDQFMNFTEAFQISSFSALSMLPHKTL